VFLLGAAAGSRPALAGGETLGLEALGSFRSYDFDSEWTRYQERLLEESLRAEYSAFIVDRSLASYNLGLTLGMVDLFASTSRQRFYRLDYDASTKIWSEGLVPVTLYARRSTLDVSEDAQPAQRSVTQTVGYSAAFLPDVGPRLRTRGYLQDMLEDGTGGPSYQRRWDLAGDASQYSGRLTGRALIEREGQVGDLSSQQKIQDTARLDADYRVSQDVSVATHALSRSYRVDSNTTDSLGNTAFEVRSDDASTHVRWRPREDLLGTATAQVRRRDYSGNSTSSEQVGVTFGIPDGDRWSAIGAAGFESSSYTEDSSEDSKVHTFAGEYLNAETVFEQLSSRGAVRVETTGGLAHFSELDVGAGLQEGIESRVIGYRMIAGPMLRLLGGARLGRQWDSSPRELNYERHGWEAGLESHPMRGLTVYLYADQLVHNQLTQDEGNSDRFQVYGSLRAQLSRDYSLEYGLNQSRNTLDDSYSGTLGQSVRGRARLADGLVWSVTGYRYLFDNDIDAPYWWTRGETELRFERGLTSVRGRLAVDLNSGNTSQSIATFAYVELRRRWRWDL